MVIGSFPEIEEDLLCVSHIVYAYLVPGRTETWMFPPPDFTEYVQK